MKVIYSSLDEYIKQLKYVNYILSEDIAVENKRCKYNLSETSLDAFLINHKGHHLSPVSTITEFKLSALTFLHLYEQIKDAHIENDGHNARILAKLQEHILELARSLLRYSHVRSK